MSETRDVLVVSPARPHQMEKLAQDYNLHRYDKSDDRDALLAEVADKIRLVMTTAGVGMPTDLLGRLPNLEVIASFGVGYDSIDIPACTARGVKVTNTPDVLNDDVADTAIMLMLSTLRRLVVGDRWARSGNWSKNGAMPLTTTLHSKKVGIVGLGRIGKAIASRAEPFGVELGYFGRSRQNDISYQYFDDLIALATWADVLVVACPGGNATRDLINIDVLKALGATGYIVNIARGSVIDEPALITALQDGVVGGAGLDVFHNEPHMNPAFAALDNVVIYPHHASGTVETRDAMGQLVVDNLTAFFAGQPLITPVN
ncbi:2-hydroxyacid dehydrogenase [Thalassospira mesophila]|uniref:Dihydrofolate reductase n=1 Tax=Thalassospira mesophila TaxID=1293891 RepID=A0A1Y2L030_9PROT|nr:2-hydroxyacid dehydrogenase [Thalassospira mesophila]OSQ38466.1 dihydrofolate reductase [Thalassospira mesophila]